MNSHEITIFGLVTCSLDQKTNLESTQLAQSVGLIVKICKNIISILFENKQTHFWKKKSESVVSGLGVWSDEIG